MPVIGRHRALGRSVQRTFMTPAQASGIRYAVGVHSRSPTR